jgi:hypothetical protein
MHARLRTRVDRTHAEQPTLTHLHRDVSLPRRRARTVLVLAQVHAHARFAHTHPRRACGVLVAAPDPVTCGRACVGVTFSRANSPLSMTWLCLCILVCVGRCALQEETQRKRAAEAEAQRKRAEVLAGCGGAEEATGARVARPRVSLQAILE